MDQISTNTLKSPRIAVLKHNDSLISISIINKADIWQTFDLTEKFTDILIYLFAYYSVFNLTYPVSHEIVLGFFHEAIELSQPVYFDKEKTSLYSKFLDSVIRNTK